MELKGTPVGGNRSLRGLPIALESHGRQPLSLLPVDNPYTLQNTQKVRNTKLFLQGHNQPSRDARNARDMQGTHKAKREHPGHVEHWSHPSKLVLPFKT